MAVESELWNSDGFMVLKLQMFHPLIFSLTNRFFLLPAIMVMLYIAPASMIENSDGFMDLLSNPPFHNLNTAI